MRRSHHVARSFENGIIPPFKARARRSAGSSGRAGRGENTPAGGCRWARAGRGRRVCATATAKPGLVAAVDRERARADAPRTRFAIAAIPSAQSGSSSAGSANQLTAEAKYSRRSTFGSPSQAPGLQLRRGARPTPASIGSSPVASRMCSHCSSLTRARPQIVVRTSAAVEPRDVLEQARIVVDEENRPVAGLPAERRACSSSAIRRSAGGAGRHNRRPELRAAAPRRERAPCRRRTRRAAPSSPTLSHE